MSPLFRHLLLHVCGISLLAFHLCFTLNTPIGLHYRLVFLLLMVLTPNIPCGHATPTFRYPAPSCQNNCLWKLSSNRCIAVCVGLAWKVTKVCRRIKKRQAVQIANEIEFTPHAFSTLLHAKMGRERGPKDLQYII